MRMIVGMTGATGAALGVRPLELLRAMPEVERHLVISRWARSTPTSIRTVFKMTQQEITDAPEIPSIPALRPAA
jgi:flavin prenyltransferase